MSMQVVPSHTRCDAIRESSIAMTRSTVQRARGLDPEQAFRAQDERHVVAHGVEIVLAVRPRDDLVVLTVLPDLLEPAMQIADVRNATDDSLAVELEHEPQHAMSRRVLWPDVDQHVIAFEVRLNGWRRADGYRVACAVHGDRHPLGPTLGIESSRRDGDIDGTTSSHSGCLLPGLFTGSRCGLACPGGRSSKASAIDSSSIEYRASGLAASAWRSCSARLKRPRSGKSFRSGKPSRYCSHIRMRRRSGCPAEANAEHVVALALEPIGSVVDGHQRCRLPAARPSRSSTLRRRNRRYGNERRCQTTVERLLGVAELDRRHVRPDSRTAGSDHRAASARSRRRRSRATIAVVSPHTTALRRIASPKRVRSAADGGILRAAAVGDVLGRDRCRCRRAGTARVHDACRTRCVERRAHTPDRVWLTELPKGSESSSIAGGGM